MKTDSENKIRAKAPTQHKRDSLARDLRTLAGSLAPGDRMPSVPDLMRDYGVASSTVQAAFETLRREAVVVSRRGSGTFVADALASARRAGAGGVSALPRPVRTKTIAVLAVCRNAFFYHWVEELTRKAADRGIAVVCRYDQDQVVLDDALALEAIGPLGFVMMGEGDIDVDGALRERGHRVVSMGERARGRAITGPRVHSDAEHGGYLAARHLLTLGHRRLTYAHWHSQEAHLTRTDRWRGHLRALREAGLADAPRITDYAQLALWRDNPREMRRYFQENEITGVVAWSDYVAYELLDAFARAGLRVPEDIALIGYDNLPGSAAKNPPLDTVDQHLDIQVEQALALLDSPPDSDTLRDTIVTPTLVCRGVSCTPRLVL